MWQYQNKKNLGYHSSWNGTKWQKTFFALKLVILTTSPTSLILPISLIINSFWKSPFQWHWSCWLYRLFLALKSLNLATFPTLNDNHKRDPSRQTGLQHKHIFIIRNFNHSTREWAKWVNRVSVQREHREAERCGASERSQRAEWVVQMNKCSEWLRGPFKMRLSKTKKRALSSQITYESPLPDYQVGGGFLLMSCLCYDHSHLPK